MNSRQSIAIVDDDARVLESIKDLLEAAGYSVLLFHSAEALIEGEGADRLDCLITDIGLPLINGFELGRIVRSTCPKLPVIFITGRHENADQQRAAEIGNQALFRKPFDAAALLSAVSQALSSRNGEEQDAGLDR